MQLDCIGRKKEGLPVALFTRQISRRSQLQKNEVSITGQILINTNTQWKWLPQQQPAVIGLKKEELNLKSG